MKGYEYLDKEMDLSNILRDMRKLRILLDMLLSNDQKILLDLKTTEHVSSEEETVESVLNTKKRSLNREKLMWKYIDLMKSKKMDKENVEFLKQLGFDEAVPFLG